MPVLNPILRELIAVGVVSPARWYVYFDGNSYIDMPTFTPTDNYFIEFDYYKTTEDFIRFFGNTMTYQSRLLYDPINGFNFRPDETVNSIYDGVNALPSLGLYKIRAEYIDGVAKVFVDGVLKFNAKISRTAGTNINAFGRQSNSTFITGYVSNININDERLYKLDKNVYPSLIFKDSISTKDGQGYNFQASAFTRSINA